ncbi:GNAT family N-acetyltransferase [Tahibacter caeni]|uniref:GNAT family N-acetyltransferase n=1 Tax=Tahibacter caeni TaxID=1453545 RepID=UPI002148F24B|nr:GNAT family protein [Tahibacter caeni]
MQLRDGDLIARPWQDGDADALYRAVDSSRAELSRWLAWCTPAYGHAEAVAWIAWSTQAWQQRGAFPFGVFDAGGDIVGSVGINSIDWENRRGALGYWIATAKTGRGHARRAAALAVDFAFGELGLQRIEILVQPGNAASHRVASALGARCEGEARNRVQFHGRAVTMAVYGLLPEDRPRPVV